MNQQTPFYNMEKVLEWSEQQSAKREAMQEKLFEMTSNNNNNWLQVMLANQNASKSQPNETLIMMQQMNNQTLTMMTQVFQQMSQQQQNNTQILVAALQNNKQDDPALLKLYEIQQQQNNLLLQNALKGGDLKEQVSLLRELSEFTEPTALGEIAKLAEAINLGDNLQNLTGAVAKRIDSGSKSDESKAPPAIPDPVDSPTKSTTQTTQADQNTQPAQLTEKTETTETTKDPKNTGFYDLLQLVKTSYLSGHTAKELSDAIRSGNPQIAATIAGYPKETLLLKLSEYAPTFGVTELTSAAGNQFVIEFLDDLSSKKDITNEHAPADAQSP
jgi:hypothetical protein